jgi:hypothetical protein
VTRLDRIETKLNALSALDRGHSLFGSAGHFGHRYLKRSVLLEDAIKSLETKLGVTLPEEVNLFLGKVHAGGPGPGYGFVLVADTQPLKRRAALFPFNTSEAHDLIKKHLADPASPWALLPAQEGDGEDDDWPPGPGFVPLAHLGCGIFDVLVLTGEQRGFIWRYDSAWLPLHHATGEQYSFLDWYEHWLDESLVKVSNTPYLERSLLGRWIRSLPSLI